MSLLTSTPTASVAGTLFAKNDGDTRLWLRMSSETTAQFHAAQRLRGILFTNRHLHISADRDCAINLDDLDLRSPASWPTSQDDTVQRPMTLDFGALRGTPGRVILMLPDELQVWFHLQGPVTINPKVENLFDNPDTVTQESVKFSAARVFAWNPETGHIARPGLPNISPTDAHLCFARCQPARPGLALSRMFLDYVVDWLTSPWNNDWLPDPPQFWLNSYPKEITSPVLHPNTEGLLRRHQRSASMDPPLFLKERLFISNAHPES